jgi:hypothetical protein
VLDKRRKFWYTGFRVKKVLTKKEEQMKITALLAALLIGGFAFAQTPAQGDHRVRLYVKRNGTTVAPHYQTNPNKTQRDNYSAAGRYNPHTGQSGTKHPKR